MAPNPINLYVCPFCGKEPILTSFGSSFWVECETYNCWVGGPHRRTAKGAAIAWHAAISD